MSRLAYREPPIDTVIRHLCRASDVAQKRRVVVGVREALNFALTQAFREQFRTSGRKRK